MTHSSLPSPPVYGPGLYLIPTPIGNLRDITLRALDLLGAADLLLCEDTRVTQKLLRHYGLRPGRLMAYHEHNAAAQESAVLAALGAGQRVALASDAGTPMLSDPGARIVRAALDAGHRVECLPGPNALLPALGLSGLAMDRFLFAGFLPPKSSARRAALAEWAGLGATLVFYEAPQRLAESLADMADLLGPDRRAAVARELTKLYEETRRDTLRALAQYFAQHEARGEIVVAVEGAKPEPAAEADWIAALDEALTRAAPAAAAAEIAGLFGLPKRQVYAQALMRKKS